MGEEAAAGEMGERAAADGVAGQVRVSKQTIYTGVLRRSSPSNALRPTPAMFPDEDGPTPAAAAGAVGGYGLG